MAQQTTSQARVIDPILTEVARGWKQPGDMIAEAFFPTVSVGARAGKIVSFNDEDFMIVATARAPGSKTGRVQFGYSGVDYALTDHSLEGVVPRELLEEGQAVPGIDQAAVALAKVQRIMELGREKEAADIALNASNYGSNNKETLSGNDQWSALSTSDPIKNVAAWREAIRAQTGFYPNVMGIPPAVRSWLNQHPVIIDRMKYTGRDIPTNELLAAMFEVERVVTGRAIYKTAAGGAPTDVWGKSVLMAYVDVSSMADMGSPSYGYTYQLMGYPFAEEAYVERNEKSFIYPYTDARKPVIAGSIAGFLASAVVA